MKRALICFLMVLVALASASFAAKAGKVATAKAAADSDDAGRFGFGLTNTSYGIAGLLQADKIVPAVKYNFTDGFYGEFGLSYSSNSIAGTSPELGILMRGNWRLYSSGGNSALLGFTANYISNVQSFASSASNNLGLTFGVETKINKAVSIGAYLTPISFTNSNSPAASGTFMNIFNNAILASYYYF